MKRTKEASPLIVTSNLPPLLSGKLLAAVVNSTPNAIKKAKQEERIPRDAWQKSPVDGRIRYIRDLVLPLFGRTA